MATGYIYCIFKGTGRAKTGIQRGEGENGERGKENETDQRAACA